MGCIVCGSAGVGRYWWRTHL